MFRRSRRLHGEFLERRDLLAVTAFSDQTVAPPTYRGISSLADLDGDGDLDVVSASYVDREISWFENTDGAGRFSAQQTLIRKTASVFEILASDIDGDGDTDLLAATKYSHVGHVLWYENLGDGPSFADAREVASGPGSGWWLYAADMDGDSDLDLVTGFQQFQQTRIAWHPNEGDGVFGQARELGVHKDLRSIESPADLDGDGDLDVVYTLHDFDSPPVTNVEIRWYENTDAAASFTEAGLLATNAGGVSSVSLADLNSDDRLDLLIVSRIPGVLEWLPQEGDGVGFGARRQLAQYMTGETELALTDWDHDGDDDLVFVAAGNYFAWLEKLDADGNFGAAKVIDGGAGHLTALLVGDIDSDSSADLVVEGHGVLSWYGSGSSDGHPIAPDAPPITDIQTVDLDGDGDDDLVTSIQISQRESAIQWRENMDGRGGFGVPERLITVAGLILDFWSADLDGDGRQDLLLQSTSSFAWYPRTDQQVAFGEPTLIEEDRMLRPLEPIDFDFDGDLDVPFAAGTTIGWFENLDGSGRFDRQTLIQLDPEARADGLILDAVGDLDGDGDLDLIGGEDDGRRGLAWYENLSSMQFGAWQLINNEPFLSNAQLADLDGDGDLDVLAHDRLSGHGWIENTGATFGPFRLITEAQSTDPIPRNISLADIDDDDDVDVAQLVRGNRSQRLVWYENDGAGNFTPRDGSSDGMMGGVTFRVADLDRNGFPDFLTASSHGEIVWQKQRVIGDSNEDGQFDSADLVHVFQTAQYEDGVAGNSRWEGGDWNGDGEFDTADLVLAFQSGNYADAVDQLLRNGLKDNFATSIG